MSSRVRALAARYRAALVRRARLLTLRGDGVECPCCNRRFRRFLPHGGRQGVVCPWCGAHERHRALCLYLEERAGLLSSDLSLLHFAPEWTLERTLRGLPNVRYLSADLDSPAAMARVDITEIPYPDDAFDAVLCSHVLEHVQDDRRAMRELHRVLRPGGWAIVLVPLDPSREETYEDPAITTPEARQRAYWGSDHLRLYGRDFKQRLEEAGFAVTVDEFVRSLDDETRERHRLLPQDDIFVCRKARAG
jgi:SAM-dependent methyltransferase